MKKSLLFTIHAVAGLVSGLFILLLSVSGSLLVFHEELDHWQYPAVSNSKTTLLSVDSCYRSLQQQFPHAQVSNCDMPLNTATPFVFSIYDPSYQNGTAVMQVFIHPSTGAVLKTRGTSNDIRNNFMSWLSAFHNSFRLHKKGEWLLGFFAVIFLFSLLTGIIMYRKNIMAVLLFRRSVYTSANLHQIIGTWALLFNLLLAFTGFWMQRYVFKKDFYSTDSYTPVLRTSPSLFFSFDSAYKNVKEQFPDFTGSVIYFAQTKKSNTAIYGSRATNSFIHSKKFADVIFLDSSGHIAKTAFVNEIPAGDRYDIINSQLHFGKYGGWPIKILYSVFGLTGGLLSVTGFLLWFKRKKRFFIRPHQAMQP
jgi:uncharacterized iron-regulated membrane protein